MFLEIALILLRIHYEILKIGRFKVTQINLKFLAGQDFQGFLPNTSIQENCSIPLVIKALLIAYILPDSQLSDFIDL